MGDIAQWGNPDAATPRAGRRFSDCKPLFLVKIMTVTKEKAPANYVPAAAVIRREQALSGFTGCKGCVGGWQVRRENHGLNLWTAFETV